MSSKVKTANKIGNIGLLQENSKQGEGGWESENPLGIFRFVTIHPWKISPLENMKNCVALLGNLKVENQDPLKLQDFFLYTPGNSTSFLIQPLNFYMFFLQYPGKFHVLNPNSYMDFFWNIPFWGVLAKRLPKSSLNDSFC